MIKICILFWGKSSLRSKLTCRESLDLLKREFVELCLDDQDVFRSEKGWESLLAILPSDRGKSLRRKS